MDMAGNKPKWYSYVTEHLYKSGAEENASNARYEWYNSPALSLPAKTLISIIIGCIMTVSILLQREVKISLNNLLKERIIPVLFH